MFLVLWEFEVKPGREQRFELVYGPGGDWNFLFSNDGYLAGSAEASDLAGLRVLIPRVIVLIRLHDEVSQDSVKDALLRASPIPP